MYTKRADIKFQGDRYQIYKSVSSNVPSNLRVSQENGPVFQVETSSEILYICRVHLPTTGNRILAADTRFRGAKSLPGFGTTVDRIYLTEDGGQWLALVKTVMNLRVSCNAGNFLSGWATTGFSGRCLFFTDKSNASKKVCRGQTYKSTYIAHI